MVDLYEERDFRKFTFVVWVQSPDGSSEILYWNGSGTLRACVWDFAIDRVPTATFTIDNPPPGGIAYGSKVEIHAGFGGFPWSIVFRGTVLDASRTELGMEYQCVGRTAPMDVTYQERPLVLTAPITLTQAVTNVLTDAGLNTFFTVDLPAWTLATVVQQTLFFATWGDVIKKMIEVEDAHWYEDRVGNGHVSVMADKPSATAVRPYFAMRTPTGLVENYPAGAAAPDRPRIRTGQKRTNVRNTKNRVIVRGATVDTVQADGTTASADITTTVSAPSPYILNPDGTQAYSDFIFSNELIDTQAKSDEVAARYLTKLNVLLLDRTLAIDGDPRVALGETVEILDYDYTGIVGNYAVVGYQTSMTDGDFVTVLQLRGGAIAPNQDPIAVFTYKVEREVMTDRVYAFVTFDARYSYDPDGTIASYSWTDNQGGPIATGTEDVFTVRVDPATVTNPWIVTLTVTDNTTPTAGTATFSLTIDVAADGEFVFNPAFTAALDTRYSGTPDGGQTWYDQAGTSVISTACGDISLAPGIAVFGTTAGGIWRTTDYCFTAPTQVMANVGSPIVDLEWDKRKPERVWAITQGGRVYRSDDAGVTWALWDSLSTVFASTNIRLNRVHSIPTGVRVYGALNGAPLIASDKLLGHVWTRSVLGGELGTDISGMPSNVYVADGGWAGDENALGIILNHSGGTVTSDALLFASGSYTGDGGTKAISGLGFTPKVVFVKADHATNSHGVYRTTDMPVMRNITNGADNQGIASLDVNGFTVTHLPTAVNGRTNEVGKTYYWFAFGGKSCKTGSYLGTAAFQPISGVGFPPSAVFISTPAVNGPLCWRTSTMGAMDADASDVGETNRILSLDADGFTVGVSTPNQDVNGYIGATYYWFALKAEPNLHIGSYIGNLTDNRTLPVVPMAFNPDLVWTKNADVGWGPAWKSIELAGDAAFDFDGQGAIANEIQSLTIAPGQFQVGSGPRANNPSQGGNQHFIALQKNSGAVLVPAPAVYYTADLDDKDLWRRGTNLPAKTLGRWMAEDMETGKFVFAFADRDHYRGDVLGGVMASTLAPAQLDVGDAPNHGLFVGQRLPGMAGVYVVSAEGTADGTLYKTFDRFATIGKLRPATGYPAMPAGANAKMAALGKGVAPKLPLLVHQSPAFSTASYARRIAKLGGNWSLVTNPAAASQLPVTLFKRLGTHLYRVTGAPTGDWKPFYGQLQRSTDEGVTWADVGPTMQEAGTGNVDRKGVSGVCLAADGSLFLTYTPNAHAAQNPFPYGFPEVYKSTDDGATWSMIYTDTSTHTYGLDCHKFIDICAHPSNANIAFVIGDDNMGIECGWYTADGGANWTQSTFPSPDCDGNQIAISVRNVVMLSNGDVLEIRLSGGVTRIAAPTYNCADNVWATIVSTLYGLVPLWVPGDHVFYVAANGTLSHLRRSDDGGKTWTDIVTFNLDAGHPFGYWMMALHYDVANDALYIGTNSSRTTERIWRLDAATQPTVGALTDLTLNLDALFTAASAANEAIGVRGITI